MEKCPNCGAAVRPGAKFCTSCGTRLEVTETTTSPAEVSTATAVDETQVATTATPVVDAEIHEDAPAENDQYASWGTMSTGESDQAVASERSGESAPPAEERRETWTASAWGKPAAQPEESDEDRFASWASAYGSYQQATSDEATTGTTTESNRGSGSAATPSAENDVTIPSGENDVILQTPAEDSEARQRASQLVEELRGLIWQIGLTENTDGDENLARIVLAGARGQTGEFSDIARSLDELANDPRDIDALRALGAKSDRIRELMNSHSRLLSAIDEAIDELR